MYIYIYDVYIVCHRNTNLPQWDVPHFFAEELKIWTFFRENQILIHLETLTSSGEGMQLLLQEDPRLVEIAPKAVEFWCWKSFHLILKIVCWTFFRLFFCRIFFFKDIWGCDGGFELFLLLNMEYSQHEMDMLISWRTLQWILKGRKHQHHLVLLLMGEILHQLIGSFSR